MFQFKYVASRMLIRSTFACVILCAGSAAAQTSSHAPDPLFHDGFQGVTAGPFNDADAARFLTQATFGPTTADIAHLRSMGYQAWLAEQFNTPASTEVPYLNWVENLPDTPQGNNYVTDDTRMQVWGINSVGTPDPSRGGFPNNAPTDQLRQRVAFALSEIFVVSNTNGTLAYEPWSLASFYDLLATDAFANYRSVLEDVTKHPAMGVFLSMIQNVKANPAQNMHPDQNYAREIMQLFSIGLNQLNIDGTLQLSAGQPVPTYTQTTVEGFAAIFTGWDWNVTSCNSANDTCCNSQTYFYCGPGGYDDVLWQQPMQPIEAYHDNTSDKQLLKYTNVALAGGVLMHGGNAQTELTAALDNIFNHPNVGPFVSRRLIQRLITSNPTPAYVQRVARAFNDDGSAQHVHGNLKAVVQAILLDPEARYGQWQNPAVFGKLREPVLKITHLWRAMESASANGRNGSLAPYPPLEDWYGEAPLRAPSVFNFFTAYFQQPGEVLARGLASPEFQILTDTMVVATPNNLFHLVFCDYTDSNDCYASDDADTMQMNDARDAALAVSDPAQLMDNYNLLFMSGQMSPFMRNVLVTRLNAITTGNRGASTGISRVQHALYLIINSPEYSIQK
jgi:uncharacterized protein (DUF1800 family)